MFVSKWLGKGKGLRSKWRSETQDYGDWKLTKWKEQVGISNNSVITQMLPVKSKGDKSRVYYETIE